jgi:Flp pilus assembly protein TadG
MDGDMLNKIALRPVSAHLLRKISEFKSKEDGAMAIFVMFLFVIMLLIGGIAVDVMRFEMRRVALQQTLDRAVLAASSMTHAKRVPAPTTQQIAQEWFDVAGLGDEFTVDYTAPTLTGSANINARKATATAKVRSYNHFMHMMNIPYMEAPVVSSAGEGIAKVEVMLVLDITGSMSSPAVSGESTTKIEALRTAAESFVTVKTADVSNGVSIGVVPYASQVNIPASLREMYNVTNVSHWNFLADQGVQDPNVNCIEIPTSTFTSVGLSTSTPMPMAAVADMYFGDRSGFDEPETTLSTSGSYLPAKDYPPSITFGPRLCTTKADDTATPEDESEYNLLLLPTKDETAINDRIAGLTADGNTSIALGMRWGTALIDQSARDIFTITDSDNTVRPFDNNDETVRKIIILMTDGEHVANNHIRDAYKSGPSPIWRGSDGRYAMSFAAGDRGPFTGNLPHATNCSGWPLANNRTFFIPHLKRNSVRQKRAVDVVEGQGTGTNTTNACDPLAWSTTARWPAIDASGNAILDSNGVQVVIDAQRLDWSEVWRFLRLEYVIRQLNNRANISGGPNVSSLQSTFRGTYLDASTMNDLLQSNCKAAREAGVEIYGIAFAAPTNGKTQIKNCASPDILGGPNTSDIKYYFDATDSAGLQAAFNTIASDITELRLTQ